MRPQIGTFIHSQEKALQFSATLVQALATILILRYLPGEHNNGQTFLNNNNFQEDCSFKLGVICCVFPPAFESMRTQKLIKILFLGPFSDIFILFKFFLSKMVKKGNLGLGV